MRDWKKVGIKIEMPKTRSVFNWHYTASDVKFYLQDAYDSLRPDQSIVVKVGSSHFYIDYDEDYEKGSTFETDRIMYYVKEYLG